ncbi:MAG: CT583 family protein [Parachlamydiales bacterium]|nr:CT583 family protein [Candidatus Acheromyda pituitae]
MAKMNSLLTQRLKVATEKLSKMTNLVEMSSTGNLSSFSGVFRVSPLSEREQESLQQILDHFREEAQEISEDLTELSAITAEVKAINNQAIILHGERIQKAQTILKKYRDGAFSAWLVATYGNRQTPYNFLQYYELYTSLPHTLHSKLDEMPRQAVYSLASREGSFDQKQEIVASYRGQPKQELLSLIRQTFPLAESDKRAQNLGDFAISSLKRLHLQLSTAPFNPTSSQKKQINEWLKALKTLMENACP